MGKRYLRCGVALACGVVLAVTVGCSANPQTGTKVTAYAVAAAQAADPAAASPVHCVTSDHSFDALAGKMAGDIDSELRGRESSVGVDETDSRTGITCQYHQTWHFYAASAIKVTILGTLLRMAQDENRQLTANEKNLAWLMITQSDNDAATALWNEVGMTRLQDFLNLAKMSETKLSYSWGLTLLTARDESLLLNLLSAPNTVLDRASRIYARYLMAHVIAGQRWGVSAGAPSDVIVHIKNGWLPYPNGYGPWVINSLGIFTATNRVYTIAVLTYDNPSETYGIDTVQDIARAINGDLNS